MAFDISSITNFGSSASGFGVQQLVPFLAQVIFLVIAGLMVWFLMKRLLFWAETRIYVAGEHDIKEVKKDFIIKKKNKRTKEVEFILMKEKKAIEAITPECRYRMLKKYHVPLIEGVDGEIRPATIALNYYDEKGKVIPYMQPVDKAKKDFIFSTAMEKQAKYVMKDTIEKIAPYATIAIVGIIIVLMIFVGGKYM